jgi:hypothetical protein
VINGAQDSGENMEASLPGETAAGDFIWDSLNNFEIQELLKPC